MSLIEQAAKRLEELRRAGAALEEDPTSAAVESEARHQTPTPEAVVRALETQGTSAFSRSPSSHESPSPMLRTARAPVHPRHIDIDLERLSARGYLNPHGKNAQIADEFRVVKRPLIRNAFAKPRAKRNQNLVMVTSALAGEGKTFTAVNLAMSMTMEINHTVLLVDGDVSHPSIPGLLGVPNEPGLLDILTRADMDVADALVRTNVEKLTILPAGSRHGRSTELLASEQMAALLRDLSSRYEDRIIIFDSPPLLATTEARVLATHMGQVVVVVAADNTSQHAVTRALATIESCEVVLMMLNKASQTEVGYYDYSADGGQP